ncbi:hypothetical protein GA0111570_108102 [Raineyella antarctica]|uniref:Uncharacterized protein n=1 Tax=Raineyella antarctica TaxID=1577474 RepID=A0A1G6HC17_9ACTN|nr:hypothetical protein [Raineyella antarctica]SDB91703.1 hypothetical protein GA0111570_108102 [Raineyella antarctica]
MADPLPTPRRQVTGVQRPGRPARGRPRCSHGRDDRHPDDRYLAIVVGLAVLTTIVPTIYTEQAWLPVVVPGTALVVAGLGAWTSRVLRRHEGAPVRATTAILARILAPPILLVGVALPLRQAMGLVVVPRLEDLADPSIDGVARAAVLAAMLVLSVCSAPLVWLFRHWPRVVGAVPLVVLLVMSTGLMHVEMVAAPAVSALVTYGTAWFLGVARQEGTLGAVRAWKVAAGASLLVAAGMGWTQFHRDPVLGADVTRTPIAAALIGTGLVLVVLRIRAAEASRAQSVRISGLIARRLVTVYLWLGWSATVVMTARSLLAMRVGLDPGGGPGVDVALALVCTAVPVVVLGAAEAFLARRALQRSTQPSE